jgi:hypothetical protein
MREFHRTVDLMKPGIEGWVHDGDEVSTAVNACHFLRSEKLLKRELSLVVPRDSRL